MKYLIWRNFAAFETHIDINSYEVNLINSSKKVENSTRKIADTLHSLSEISFVFPYTENRPKNFEDIEKVLRRKLDEMTKPVEGKN